MKKLIATALFALVTLSGAACTKGPAELNIGTVGDTMAFDTGTLEVSAGQVVKLTLKNNGTSQAMQHNWVLAKPGTESEVSMTSMSAGAAKDFIASGNANILAHTRLTKPGESDTITFTAPSTPGDYPFLCTFPGHFPLMKGVLKVQ